MEKNFSNNLPLVSVLIRTCGRVDLLKKAIESVESQTYANIEIIVVEDGENVSEKEILNYKKYPVKYFCTYEKRGRSYVGNIALSKAAGEYFNFLDDDDIFYPKHIEKLVNAILESDCRIVYSKALECQLDYKSKKIKKKYVRYNLKGTRFILRLENFLPIQSVIFSRELYDSMGGFNENLDSLEDWDLWLRYTASNDIDFLDEITSQYHVPYLKKKHNERKSKLDDALETVLDIQYEKLAFTSKEIHQEISYLINTYRKNDLYNILKKIWNKISKRG